MTLLSLVAAELSSMVEGTQQTLSSVWQLPPHNLIKGQALPPQWQQDSPQAVGTFCHPRWQVSLTVVEHLVHTVGGNICPRGERGSDPPLSGEQ